MQLMTGYKRYKKNKTNKTNKQTNRVHTNSLLKACIPVLSNNAVYFEYRNRNKILLKIFFKTSNVLLFQTTETETQVLNYHDPQLILILITRQNEPKFDKLAWLLMFCFSQALNNASESQR